jgi:hypothetical protein
VNVQLPEDLSRVEQVVLLEDPTPSQYSFSDRAAQVVHVLLAVPGQQRQVQDERDPVSVDKEEEGQETVNGGLGDDVGVEAVAKVDGVDVVAGAKLAYADRCAASQRSAR